MHELRQYQRDAANAAWKGFKEFDKQLVVLPTGSGKTVIFAKMAALPALQPALILAHRDELVTQAVDQIRIVTGLEASVEKAESHGSRGGKIVVASMQTMASAMRLATWPKDHFKFVVVDEAHHALSASWQSVLGHFGGAKGFQYFGGTKILGVTATPHRGDKKNLGKYFENIAYEITLLELVKQGFLCPIKVRTVPLKIDLTGIKRVAGDYGEKESGMALEPMLQQIGEEIMEYASEYKSLIFLPLRQTSRKLCSVLQSLGMRAEHIDGDDPQRKEKLERFKTGDITHLCNAMLLSEGYDEPSIQCIIPLRPTASQPLYAQMVGRGTRVFPGKDSLLILDFLWLHEKHSLIRPAHLVAGTSEIAEAMTAVSEAAASCDGEDGEYDLFGLHADALHEREESLRRELAKKAGKKSKLVDALEYALDIGEVASAEYEPVMPWESLAPTVRQLELIAKLGIAPETISCRGHAAKVMAAIFYRNKMKLATAKQLHWLRKMGHPAPNSLTEAEATKFLSQRWEK